MDADVAVVGAGPAGVAAAVHLARAGLSVIMIDKAAFPRDKICGDGLTTAALRELQDLGLATTSVPSWQHVDDIVVRSPSGRATRFPLPRGRGSYAVVATRLELDAALVDVARAAGVEVREDTPLVDASETADGVVITTAAGEIRARYAIGADGMWSPLRKALGLATPDYRGEWHAFRQYVSGVTGIAAHDLVVFFEQDFLPGYFWAFPLGEGRANIGFGIQRGEGIATREMAALWRDLLTRPHIREVLGEDFVADSPHRAWPIPARIDTIEAGRGRTLFVGDAVAACDPMTGEGIGQALITGRMAAAAICGSPDPATVQARYRHSIDAELVPDHRMSMLLIKAIRHRKGARIAQALAGANGWSRRNFARWLFEDEPRGVLLTPSRWHRNFLGRPGAY
jgi:geranylgeranyl reductase family protein